MRLRVLVLLSLGLGSVAWGVPRSSLPMAFPYVRGGQAMSAPQPGEGVLLTLEGRARPLRLTRAQLLTLPTVRYTTHHAQLDRTFTYEGVPLRDLAVLGGFGGKDMRLYASNGYVTTLHARDYLEAPIMLAHTANGHPISVLEKGPLTVVLPDDPARFPRKQYGSAWVWFVERITPAP
ncbi:hypothetical protein [Deinococcus hopiensis]|uniref:Oxidoreductase molybdopterin-binding domain-containing protein n=1 Tax=Deinococcus hopiensis KR-140 TaxID=695939 RepID=A0A1W1VCK0_9DEIO|nr:hypothetical protein [Deinococcus hopiensis]SMB91026.1 hypothetical protein SAMN00790413_00958 [Deinococcus hopiensis KR-140]